MYGYMVIGSNVYALEKSLNAIANSDALVLDIDGVILDVGGSFRVAISRTAQRFLVGEAGFEDDATAIVPEKTQFFKLAGGFNNDWELTNAAVLFYLGKAERHGTKSLLALKKESPSIKTFCGDVHDGGGGLKAAQDIVFGGLGAEQKEHVFAVWNRILIKRLFQEIYSGDEFCRRLYGFDPEYVRGEGLIGAEQVIVEREKLEPFGAKLGILSGRTREEAELALERAGLADLFAPENVLVDDGGPIKPDPAALDALAKSLGAKSGLYLGDTPDDLAVVKNARRPGAPARWLSAVVARDLNEADVYFEAKADVVGVNVNAILAAVTDMKEHKDAFPLDYA